MSSYVTKLGLELTSQTGKVGDGANRTPMQIARDIEMHGRASDKRLWATYVRAMKGARMLTWTRGLRASAGLGRERDDLSIVQDEGESERIALAIDGITWDLIRHLPNALTRLLEAAEQSDDAAAVTLRSLVSEAGRLPPPPPH